MLRCGPIGLAQSLVCHTHGILWGPYSASSYRASGAPAPGRRLAFAPVGPLRGTVSSRRQPRHVQPASPCGPLPWLRTSAARPLPRLPQGLTPCPSLVWAYRRLPPARCLTRQLRQLPRSTTAQAPTTSQARHTAGPQNCRPSA
ncbi:hypothetical protein NDU88_005860 [Pleurodeles waltl]|uniref:Uncharacterized protein n=1 Tax=Pleurodeles waltl TaxID=8319 RepID=A0AAV7N1D6_PLEWA|nr:hypothetical protein NDU88_005860 [Pleurodeles waltl]